MEKNTIITLTDMLGKKHDFRVCDECHSLVLTEDMYFNRFNAEQWLCIVCVRKKKWLKWLFYG